MNTIKKTIITLFVSSLFISASSMAYAEEAVKAAAEKPAAESVDTDAKSIKDVIAHLEQASAEAAKSSFTDATRHLKAARSTAGEIGGHALGVHKGVNEINASMREVKLGHPEKAVAEIDKAIEIYKAM